jgi:hypothetical protein
MSSSVSHLLLERRSGRYRGYWSPDGGEWVVVGAEIDAVGVQSLGVGLLASDVSEGASEIPADFDYFCLRDAPERMYLPVMTASHSP